MRVYLGSDHAGYELKNRLVDHLRAGGHEPVDCGPDSYDPDDDYPAYCIDTAQRTAADPGSLGVVIGGSGNGEAIAANKVDGARCALLFSEDTARLAREHNDARVISIGARMNSVEEAKAMVETFLSTAFSEEERHVRRLAMIARYEEDGALPVDHR